MMMMMMMESNQMIDDGLVFMIVVEQKSMPNSGWTIADRPSSVQVHGDFVPISCTCDRGFEEEGQDDVVE